MNLLLVSILYLIFGLGISFTISFFYLRHYPKKDPSVKFAFYSSVVIFGLIIFFIFLIPFDIACSALVFKKNIENGLLEILPIYYLVFGYFSQIAGDIISPIMILIHTSGFYTKGDIFKDVLKRFFTDYFSLFKLIFVFVLSIPSISFFVSKDIDIFEILKTILIYLNFFPYLKILYYIGFVCQDLVYSYIRKIPLHRENYDIWKLGKIYKYYNREKIVVNGKYKIIKEEIERANNEYGINLPMEFLEHFAEFKYRVEITQRNLLFIHSEREKVKLATDTYKGDFKKEKQMQVIDDNNNNNNNNNNNDNNNDDSSMMDDIFSEAKNEDEESLKAELGSDYQYIYGNSAYEDINNEQSALLPNNSEDGNEDLLDRRNIQSLYIKKRDKQFINFDNFKNYICNLMTDVNESSISVQRKSYLINTKGVEILSHEAGKGMKAPNPCILVIIIFFYVILFFLEMPWSIYDWFPKEIKSNFFGNLCVSLSSIMFYFFIFNYAVIHHRYMSGDLIFGRNESNCVNFYNFISYVLGICDAVFYHSVWVLRKYKLNEKSINSNDINKISGYFDYYFSPKYYDVFELPEVFYHGYDIIPYISAFIIIISIFNAAKFSNIKIRRKERILFNENADYFYNEKNLYSNFILGCGVLVSIKINMDDLIRLRFATEELKRRLFNNEIKE